MSGLCGLSGVVRLVGRRLSRVVRLPVRAGCRVVRVVREPVRGWRPTPAVGRPRTGLCGLSGDCPPAGQKWRRLVAGYQWIAMMAG